MDIQNRHLLPGKTPSKPGGSGDPIPSSSPAFATPAGPIRPAAVVPDNTAQQQQQPPRLPPVFPQVSNRTELLGNGGAATAAIASANTILPVLIPPATLRPLAFRVFTKRHNLTIQTSALATLATFVGRHCGSGWRDEGLAEKVLEETAKRWKRNGGTLIVDGGDGSDLAKLLKELAGVIVGGRIVIGGSEKSSTIENSSANATASLNRQASFGVSKIDLNSGSPATTPAEGDSQFTQRSDAMDEDAAAISGARQDPRQHLKVVNAFDQPRLTYNASRRHFEKAAKPASLFPEASSRTDFYKQRYHMVHQRLMRNESFQAPTSVVDRTPRHIPSLQRSASSFVSHQSYKLSNVTDLLGRHGSAHILLGLLTLTPAGHYAISDLSGSIMLDLSLALSTPDWAWIVPGMMVIVDGTYEEEGSNGTAMVGSNTGIGGTIGGRFVAASIASPPPESREKTLGIIGNNSQDDFTATSGFGWVDFLGVGSEKAAGVEMRKVETHFQKTEDPGGRGRIVVLGDLNLDVPETFEALRKILGLYEASEPGSSPMSFILTGNFISTAGMARAGTAGSIDYKESFDLLASTLSDYPRLLSSATFIFVPGDNDPWASAFSASASTTMPRKGIPASLTSRVRRAFQTANTDRERTAGSNLEGEAAFTSNPARISLFGPAQELVILRDDMTGRIRRSIVDFNNTQEDSEADGDAELDGMQVDNQVAAEEMRAPEIPNSRTTKKGTDQDVKTARQLVKMIVDQSYLSPFSVLTRPILWDYAPALHMVPLPTAMVIVDTEAPAFALGYGGCFVMNPGRCLVENRKGQARWIEFDAVTKRGKTMQIGF